MSLASIETIDCYGSPYKLLVEPESQDIIFSVNFLRTLSRRFETADFAFLQGSNDAMLAAEVKKIAQDDLISFLKLRLNELRVGGRLIVTFPYAKTVQKRGFIGQFMAHAWNRLADTKLITEKEKAALIIHEVFRTEEEVDACLEAFSSQAEVIENRVFETHSEAYDKWIEDQKDWNLAKDYTELTLAQYADEIDRALEHRPEEEYESIMTSLRIVLTDVFVDHCPKALFSFHIIALSKLETGKN